jgi:hypothetical protein
MGEIAITAAVDLLVAVLNNAASIGAIIQKAQTEGRANLTADEWATVTGGDDTAMAALAAEIAQKGT